MVLMQWGPRATHYRTGFIEDTIHHCTLGEDDMNVPEIWFLLGNVLILPCWALLLFFPQSSLAVRVFHRSRFSPLHLLGLIYLFVVVPSLWNSPESMAELARPTLEGVKALLGSESGAAAGWIHYLCFDLFVGVAVWRSARERSQSFLWVSPVLVLVLMLGPLGWLSYEAVSGVDQWRKS